MPLVILTKRKELHGFLFLCIRVVPFSIIIIKANISGKRKRTGAEKQDGERACKVQDVFTGGCSTVCCRLVAEGHP